MCTSFRAAFEQVRQSCLHCKWDMSAGRACSPKTVKIALVTRYEYQCAGSTTEDTMAVDGSYCPSTAMVDGHIIKNNIFVIKNYCRHRWASGKKNQMIQPKISSPRYHVIFQ